MNTFTLSAKMYDFLKSLVLVVIPGIATLYIALGNIWGWDNVTNVTGTLAAVAVFLGAMLQLAKRNYNNDDTRYDGETWVTPTDEGWKRVFNVTTDVIDPAKTELSFKVIDEKAA